ncbi:MAG: hypothetical protein WCS77_05390 [Elusimicrobiaceae bacterium]
MKLHLLAFILPVILCSNPGFAGKNTLDAEDRAAVSVSTAGASVSATQDAIPPQASETTERVISPAAEKTISKNKDNPTFPKEELEAPVLEEPDETAGGKEQTEPAETEEPEDTDIDPRKDSEPVLEQADEDANPPEIENIEEPDTQAVPPEQLETPKTEKPDEQPLPAEQKEKPVQ